MLYIAWLFTVMIVPCIALRSEGNCTIISEGRNGTTECPNIQGRKMDIQASGRDSTCNSIFQVQKITIHSLLSSAITNGSHFPFLCDVSVCKNSLSNCSGNEDKGGYYFCYQSRSDLLHQTRVSDIFSLLSLIGVLLVLIVPPIIILFNCNLVTGPIRSLIFMYQCLPLTGFPLYFGIQSFIVWENQLYTNLFYPLTILNSTIRPVLSHYYFFEYFKHIIVFVYIVLVLFLNWCSGCPLQKCRLPWAMTRRAVRKFREKHTANRTLLHGIFSCIVLAYGDLVAITFNILSEGVPKYCFSQEDMCPQQCPDSNIFVTKAIPAFFIIACFALVFLLLPPLLFIIYPLIPYLFVKLTKRSLPRLKIFSKLHPWFDVFQGVYKDKHRWYAGLHLLYLVFLWAINAGLTAAAVEAKYRVALLSFCFILILGIHSLLQPYKQQRHNYCESLHLLYLVLGSFAAQLYLFLVDNQFKNLNQFLAILAFGFIPEMILVWFPVMTACAMCCCKRNICRRCRMFRCCPCVNPSRDKLEENDTFNSESFQREQFLYYDPAA